MSSPSTARPAVPMSLRSRLILLLTSLVGLAMFCWPLLVSVDGLTDTTRPDAPFIFLAVLPILILLVIAQMSDGGIDAKALAMLGVLSAVNAALRPLGAGVAGIEVVFFLLVLAGRVFGPAFGFLLGCTSLFASALLTAGVGPWLPFQMLCSAWIGLGAGLLPRRVTGRAEIAMLAAYGVVVAYLFGLLMNLWFWPFLAGGVGSAGDPGSSLAYDAAAPLGENLRQFLVFSLVTSTAGWDTGRAITNLIAIVVLGPAVLAVLRRASRRAVFGAVPQFAPTNPPVDPHDPAARSSSS